MNWPAPDLTLWEQTEETARNQPNGPSEGGYIIFDNTSAHMEYRRTQCTTNLAHRTDDRDTDQTFTLLDGESD